MTRARPSAKGKRSQLFDDGPDRAVSDVVAHVLIFAIIISGVAVVAAGAFNPLVELSDREQIENSERGMKAAAATLDDIHRQSGTQRSFNIVPGGGTVFLNESFINITSPNDLEMAVPVNSTEHRFDQPYGEVTVAYESGGVFRSPGVGASYGPSITCGNDMAIVSLVRLQGGNFHISAGAGTTNILNPRSVPSDAPVADLGRSIIFNAEVTSTQRNVTSFGGPDSTGTVRIDVSSSAVPDQWARYFQSDQSAWSQNSGDYECSDVAQALVRVVTIELETGY